MDTETNLKSEEVIEDDKVKPSNDQPSKEPDEAKNTKYEDAVRGLSEKGRVLAKYEAEMTDLARENPDVLHSIKDNRLKNKISKKLYGLNYAQAVEVGKVGDSNDDDERREYLDIRHKLAKNEERERAKAEKSFFGSKGIIISDYDDNYNKVMEQLETFAPSVLEDDYEGALEKAYVLALPDEQERKKINAAKMSEELATPGGGRGTTKQVQKGKQRPSEQTIRMWKGMGAFKALKEHGIEV